MKSFIFIGCILILGGFSTFSQNTAISGRILDSHSNEPIVHAKVTIVATSNSIFSDSNGQFTFSQMNIPAGEYILQISKEDYLPLKIPIKLNPNAPLVLNSILMQLDYSKIEGEIGVISLSQDELDSDDSATYAISGLLQASKDVFLNAASYDFSATFFKPRGYNSEHGTVLINGIEMNKLYNGRPLWSNWGGLNDAQRNQVFSMGLTANEYTFGDLAGTTNIIMRASKYRKGGRLSYATSNRSYRGRVMASYNSGLLPNGWAYSLLLARRFAKEGFNEGTLYDANSFFIAVEKRFNERNSLNLTAFYTPNRRGKSSPNTQEVYDLKGTRYNAYWGKQEGEIRNSRIKEVKEPVIMLNHFYNFSENSQLNTNLAYQFGKIGNSRLGYDNVPNPDPSYYKKLPSYFMADSYNPDYEGAYRAYLKFVNDGQIDWQQLYETNLLYAGTARYYLYEDRNDDTQLSANTILNSVINNHFTLTASLNFKNLKSKNFASMIDLLGGYGYLDVDTFNTGDESQSDLNNPNRIANEGDKIKYNFNLNATEYHGFVQGNFSYSKIDFYAAGKLGGVAYQRNGLFKNGNFPDNSFGKSEKLAFTLYGLKAGGTYKLSGRHIFGVNGAYFTNAPTLRNSFSNSRQNNATVVNLTSEKNLTIDGSYFFRTAKTKMRLTGYYTLMREGAELSFYYADGISVPGRSASTAFVQEVLTNINKRNIGGELGLETQITPTVKLKAAAAYGQYTYNNNPNLYLTSDDFTDVPNGAVDYGKASLKNYRVAGGPQQAYQIGFEYRNPAYWWFGATTNYFSNAYLDISPLTRTANFYLDTDGIPFNDYDANIARDLLRQEQFDSYFLVNVIGGKSWKYKQYYFGFFASINNILNQEYKTGGFEQGRSANYRTLLEDTSAETRIFGPKYWYGYGTTYYVNFYVRF
ncbi:MAG: TonB-dependent receptor [Aequorivita sp.]|nr:TonB-dependent receptor [Aequorivita sp.]|tara:strand:+ start:29808 stop:32573 length:2766 start_codon:yes stop_codon:yes gene_type:complete